MKVKRIGNIRLLSVPDNKFKNFKIAISFETPQGKEYATLNSLLFKVLAAGCEKYPTKKDINLALKKLYGSSMVSGSSRVKFSLCPTIEFDALSDRYCGENLLKSIFELLSEIIFKPLLKDGGFDGGVFNREKSVLSSEIAGLINDKRKYAVSRCLEITCGADPYGAPPNGDLDVLRDITPKRLYEHYEHLIGNTAVTIAAVGSFDEKALEDEVQTLQNKFGAGDISDGDILENLGKDEKITEESDITQGKLTMAFSTGVGTRGDFIGETVLNGLFGGGVSSKLFNVVREKMSLCYYASSVYYKYKGIILAQAGIDFGNFEKTAEAIKAQLVDIQNGSFTDEELENVKVGLVNSALAAPDDIDLLSAFYGAAVFDAEILSPTELAQKYMSVTREQIIELSRLIKLETTYFLCGGKEGRQ